MVKAILARQNPDASEVKFSDGQTFQQKLNNGSLTGPTGPQGPAGANGAPGAKGDKGDTGPNQVSTTTSTNINGILKGNGSTVVAAAAGIDYPTVATVNGKLSLTGGTMTGAIAMSNKKITGLATCTADADAANKAYVDSQINDAASYAGWGNQTEVGNSTWWANLRTWVLNAPKKGLESCLGKKKKVSLSSSVLGLNSGAQVSMICVGYNCDGPGNSLTFQTEGVLPTITVFGSSAVWSSSCTAQNYCTNFGNYCSASSSLKQTTQWYCSTTPDNQKGHLHDTSYSLRCFIPSECQMGWNNTNGFAMSQDEWSEGGQKIPYQWYTSNNRRKKYGMDATGNLTSSTKAYWERSLVYSNTGYACNVFDDGKPVGSIYNYSHGLAPAFVIG